LKTRIAPMAFFDEKLLRSSRTLQFNSMNNGQFFR